MAFSKGDKENILVESLTTQKSYSIEDLNSKKAGLEKELASIDALIAEAVKLGVKELQK